MFRQIYKYEVTYRIAYKDGRQELKTLILHAYSVGDACMQGIYQISTEEIEKITINSVGPPAEDVRSQEKELARALDKSIEKLIRESMRYSRQSPYSDKLPEFTDAVATEGSKATVSRKL